MTSIRKKTITELNDINEGQLIYFIIQKIMRDNGFSKKHATKLIINFLNKD